MKLMKDYTSSSHQERRGVEREWGWTCRPARMQASKRSQAHAAASSRLPARASVCTQHISASTLHTTKDSATCYEPSAIILGSSAAGSAQMAYLISS
jgi:hypothetical protein